ncbi:hypothetical protein IVA95_29100 [Bradyrhizobium sp. 157]|uniref:hypothetical protein n=1 Tax=Bradyrhizobium sp. 157 TaxID=2782631 RepID=UPI001FFA92FD|nr:hypothetical protein [Bradyrhizobium sp. 157]MCK1641495.1 hypothetical protein [Bradyrhizobium sp. 157]
MIQADIATKIISPETSIWVVFPGRRRRFINNFLRQQHVFLETPGIALRPEMANDYPSVRRHVRMSGAISEYHLHSEAKKFPSRNPNHYADSPIKDAGLRMLASSVRKMFGRMKSGDLVVVPGRMFNPVYFGEVTASFKTEDTLQVERYGQEEIPFRRVRWLNPGVPRHIVPQHLQGYLAKPPAIAHVARSPETEDFFRFAYPAYVLADKSAVMMDGPKYDGKNPLATIEANYLVAYFIAAFHAIEKEQLETFTTLNVPAAIEKFYDPELVQSFTQNFNSPGKYALSALSAVLGTFVSVGIAIAISQLDASDLHEGIEVTNSVSPQDAHINKDSGIKLDYLFKSLHNDKIKEINHLGKRAKEQIGLTTPVRIKVKAK